MRLYTLNTGACLAFAALSGHSRTNGCCVATSHLLTFFSEHMLQARFRIPAIHTKYGILNNPITGRRTKENFEKW